MEMVSASKMRRAQEQALAARPYTRAIQNSLQKVAQSTDSSLHPLLAKHEEGKDILVIFSTDRGLSGALNPNLFKAAWQWCDAHENFQVIVIGKKAVAFAKKLGLNVAAQFTDMPEVASVKDILPLANIVSEGFLNKEYKRVSLLHMDFINTLSQKVKFTQLLPLSVEVDEADQGVVNLEIRSEYTFEPSAAEILNELLPYYLENTLFQTLLEAKASEHSARMVAMKNASENAKELVSELKLIFNKSRQASITNELLDITTATLTVSQ